MNKIEAEHIEKLLDTDVEKLTSEDLSIKKVFDDAIAKACFTNEIKHLLKHSPIHFLKPQILNIIKMNMIPIEYIPTVFLEDYSVAQFYIHDDFANILLIPEHYRDNETFIRSFMHINGDIFKYASERIQHIEEIARICLDNSHGILKYLPDEFKTKENCLLSLTGLYPNYSSNWQYFPLSLQLNEEFIKEAGVICPSIYKYIEPSIRDKYEITEYFIHKNGSNLQYACDEHKNNRELVLPIINKKTSLLEYVSNELRNDVQFILPLLKKDPNLIHVCGESIKNNIDIATYICNIKTHEPAIIFFNNVIKSNTTIAMQAVLSNPESMNYISKSLSSDPDFISLYLEQENFKLETLHYISPELKNNAMIMMKAYDRDTDSIQYVGNILKYDEHFLEYIFSPKDATLKNNPSKHILFINLKSLSLVSGDEDILYSFLRHSSINVDENTGRQFILNAITDHKFKTTLQSQKDLYTYVKSASLVSKLNDNLIQRDNKTLKIKI